MTSDKLPAAATSSAPERFAAKVDKHSGPAGCWLWTAARDPDGYGRFWLGRRMVLAHRAAWRLYVGPIPEGKYALHRCDNPACVNPAHLFLGTQADNQADMVAKGRSARGQKQHNSKLTERDVRRIRKMYAAGLGSQRQLAARFGVSHASLCFVVNRKTWRHVMPVAGVGGTNG